MDTYRIDYETTSACDISLGSFRYACDPSTRILMFAISKNDGPPQLWDFLDPHSDESLAAESMLRQAVSSGALISAFNVMFELAISYYRLEKDVGVPCPAVEQLRCTRAKALRAAIPASLAKASEFLKLGVDKDTRGKALIGIFSDQSKVVTLRHGKETMKSHSPILEETIPWGWSMTVAGESVTVREAWEMFKDYCRKDVVVEAAVDSALQKYELTGSELDGFLFDLRMNLRGIPVHVPALRHAKSIVDSHQAKLTEEFGKLTGLQPTQTAKVLAWLRAEGYPGENLQAATMEQWLGSSFLTPAGLRALTIRSQLSFAAVKKVGSMLDTVCPDGRMRGLFTWYGAQRTGRWTASGPQPQNAKKPTIDDPDSAFADICDEVDIDLFEWLHGNPYEAVASCVRNFIQPPQGKMIDTDLANIESRVAALMAGQESMLDAYRQGRDLYKELAVSIFKVKLEEVTKEQRFVAKTASLACIAEGELVLTDSGLIPIEQVCRCHRVWDGVEWVHHEGVVYQGEREVIEYQGLKATEDHHVYCRDRQGRERKIPFGEAKSFQNRIITTERGGEGLRASDDYVFGTEACRESRGELRIGKMQMRGREVGLLPQPDIGKKSDVQVMLCPRTSPWVVAEKSDGADAEVQEPAGQRLQALRGERHSLQLQELLGCVQMDHGKSRSPQGDEFRPDRQQWPLRSGEFEVGYDISTGFQQEGEHSNRGFQPERMALRAGRGQEAHKEWPQPGSDIREGTRSSETEAETVEGHSRKVRVYDILNAGPRRRFTVSGLLVSNCVYQTGAKTFHETCAMWGMPIEKKLACHTVKTFRETNEQFPITWRKFERAALTAMETPGEWVKANQFVSFAYSRAKPFPRLLMRLPSGRYLTYPYPEVRRTTKRHKDYDTGEVREWESDDLTFYGGLRGHVGWGRVSTYAGDLFQSAVQGTARDILQHGCVTAERNGFNIWAVIHDQALADEGDVDLFIKCLCSHPDWIPDDFPLAAEGFLCNYYAK